MSGFYKGNNILNDKVLTEYTKGYYTDNKGQRHVLCNRINKYNINYIRQVNDLNSQWYAILIIEQVALKLMGMNSNSKHGEIRNIWNLMKAQGGTIRFNRFFRNSLRSYVIDRQEIIKSIEREINTQKDRLIRNNKLVIELLKDYGFSKLMELIQKENNMTITEHIIYFTDNIEKDLTFGMTRDNEDEINEYYDSIINDYIQYLTNIANKYDLSLNNCISDTLLRHREVVNTRYEQLKKEKAEEAERKKREKALISLNKADVSIQHDVMSSYDSKKHMLSLDNSIKLYDKIKKLGGKVWYVSGTPSTAISYFCTDGSTTSSVCKMVLFNNEVQAKEFRNNIKKMYPNYYVICNCVSIIMADKNKNKSTRSMIEFLESELNDEEPSNNHKKIIIRAIKDGNGVWDKSSETTVIVYIAIDKKGIAYFVELNNDGSISILSTSSGVTLFNTEYAHSKKLLDKIQSKLVGYKIEEHKLNINSNWYYNKLAKVLDEENFLIKLIYSNKNLNIIDMPTFMQGNDDAKARYTTKSYIEGFREKLQHYANNGYTEVYIVFDSASRGKYYCNGTRSKRTNSLLSVTVFTDKNEATRICEQLYDEYHSSIIRVFTIPLYH